MSKRKRDLASPDVQDMRKVGKRFEDGSYMTRSGKVRDAETGQFRRLIKAGKPAHRR